jgi:hypothetical protein
MASKRISEVLKMIEFINEEVKEISKRLTRVTPREVSDKLGNLALLREKILSLEVELPPEIERKFTELYPVIEKIKAKPS